MKSKIKLIPVIIMVIICSLVNIPRVFGTVLWADEIFSYELVQKSWSGIIEGTINDFHPPLYYLFVKCFCTLFGYSIISYRVASLIAVLITVVLGGNQIRRCFGKSEAMIFSVCMLIAPTMYYSVEIRMYSWALCFVTLVAIFSYDFLVSKSKKALVGMIITGIMAAYTHYFALIIVALVYGALFLLFLVRKEKKQIVWLFIGIMISLFAYLPWIEVVMSQIAGYGKTAIEIKSVFYYIKVLFGFVCLFSGTLRTIVNLPILDMILTALGALVLIILLVSYYIRMPRENSQKDLFFILMIVVGGTFFAGIIMDMLSHTFVARYFYPVTGIIWILVALAMVDWCRRMPKSGMVIAIFLLVLFTTDCMITIKQEKLEQELHEKTMEYVQNNVDKYDLIVTDYALYSWNVLKFYFPDIDNKKYSNDKEFQELIKKYEDVWFVHAKQINSNDIFNRYQWKECLNGSFAENECIIYKLE